MPFRSPVAVPVRPLLPVIILPCRQAPVPAAPGNKGSQPHIHAVDEAVHGRLIEHFNQTLPQASKELGVIQLTPPALRYAIFRPGKD